jgi:diaminopimelate decarboxylase
LHHFAHRGGVLHAEDVPVPEIAAAVGTPFYCYSTATLTRHYKVFDEAFAGIPHMVCYAMKANSNQAVLATLARLGAGADVVSEGELRRALAAGFSAEKILFSGVGKTGRELLFALEAGIGCFNVESEPELERLSAIAASRGLRPRSACASTPTSTRAPTQRSPPDARETSSGSPSAAPERSTPAPPPCPASG